MRTNDPVRVVDLLRQHPCHRPGRPSSCQFLSNTSSQQEPSSPEQQPPEKSGLEEERPTNDELPNGSSTAPNGESLDDNDDDDEEEEEDLSRRTKLRRRVTQLARNMVVRPLSTAYNMPHTIAEVLRDATVNAVDLAVDEVFKKKRHGSSTSSTSSASSGGRSLNLGSDPLTTPMTSTATSDNMDLASIVDEAFAPMEQALRDMEQSLEDAKTSLQFAKSHAYDTMGVIQAAAIAQAEAAAHAMARAEDLAERKALVDFYSSTLRHGTNGTIDSANADAAALTLEDVDFTTSEMAPPFLDEDSCLVPGEPVVRVERAPENSRRIFAGIDILSSVDVVWNLLTDYDKLDQVVPNLLVNQVLERYPGTDDDTNTTALLATTDNMLETDQCQALCEQMRGAKLRQVGGAKVVGINFSARTTLEVREWPQGLPDFAHFQEPLWQGKSRKERAQDMTTVPLERYRFPRPFGISQLPTRDITMQSILGEEGEFRMYQGVWRMQPLPGCAPPGQQSSRLTYAVEGTSSPSGGGKCVCG